MEKTICICGGGSLGHVCAGVLSSSGYRVNILTGHPDSWSKSIDVEDIDGHVYKGEISVISASASVAIPDADIILLCLPGYLIRQQLEEIKPFLRHDAIVGSIVSSTGFFFEAHDILSPETPLFGFQRVPYIARVREYGKSAELLGYKESLNMCFENVGNINELRMEFSNAFKTPVNVLSNYYEVSLTNSNPILHTGRLYAMWHGKEDELVENPVLFYSEWNDEASIVLLAMDDEFRKLLDILGVSQDAVPSLLKYYESTDYKSLTEKIRSIEAFKSIKAPMINTGHGWLPDFGSRYFTEDFPYGLRYIRDLAKFHGIETPTIDKVYEWGLKVIDRN